MALIKCKECGKEISDKAYVCPNCGYELNKKENKANMKSNQMKTGSIISLISCSIIIVLIIILCVSSFMPQNEMDHSQADVSIEIGESYVVITPTIGIYLISFLITTILTCVLSTLFLCNKIKKVKLYKIALVLISVLQMIFCYSIITFIFCCGIIVAIFPIINFIGSIIVATGKSNI